MRLEPISERPPQHARRGSRRAALHHVVFAVEEIYGVARIERHGRESRKRRKLRSRPLPPVPHKIVHTEGARPRGMCHLPRGIPRFEIEVSSGRARPFFTPGIAALSRALWRPIGGPVKLRFRRQFAAQPLRIRSGLGMTHINRPFLRQTNLSKHRSVNPEIALAPPEHGMLDAFLRFPGPGFVTPKRAVPIASGLHKPQKIVIRYIVIVDRELVHNGFVRPKFVVPPEFIAVNAL